MQNRNTPLTESDIAGLDWAKLNGLLPAIVQDRSTQQVLMLAYMNEEALRETLSSGRTVFYSRSRQELWRKGETSGARLGRPVVYADCDNDTLLVFADPVGPACHLGDVSCFMSDVAPGVGWIAQLEKIIDQRAVEGGEGSYVRNLMDAGIPRMAQKVGEEAVETALAAALDNETELRDEAADLLFHLTVLLRAKGVSTSDIVDVLRARHGD
ncbi:MAG: bifunctional phosphoribosyl-AMP cyclohydrolase/phosphoribosyl-ATP diphosphatase HisIE [Marinicaulis sp.]|nr:bifunctional phosphoribosyl-AMP cyclohydrolase/phosphoribosyl-ATP diphosphatase HisIE [Marinicaulis sp.]NNE40994.1 bifunctional phosphoribosyl-AMP cyclohydrolase/phosphoribosyl-ATP diphosphatase HisIE [Marinicaulis sp.]NNL88667.1 bifunctional phosphoribosyl-AMP cyclohydrolase/phosphoribosyl-ATP diphosphatase HisIE [Marinicaulis sp.]